MQDKFSKFYLSNNSKLPSEYRRIIFTGLLWGSGFRICL